MLSESVDTLRQGVRDMRTLLVEIHPPRLETAGLEPVLDDLLSPAARRRDRDVARRCRRAGAPTRSSTGSRAKP